MQVPKSGGMINDKPIRVVCYLHQVSSLARQAYWLVTEGPHDVLRLLGKENKPHENL